MIRLATLGVIIFFVTAGLVAIRVILFNLHDTDTQIITQDNNKEGSARIVVVKAQDPVFRRGSVLSNSPLSVDSIQGLTTIELANLPRSYTQFIEAGAQFMGQYEGRDIFITVCDMKIETGYSGLVNAIGQADDWNDGKGGFVTIERVDTLRTITYSHLSVTNVEVGDFVERGHILGKTGASGEMLLGGACQVGITR